MRWIVLIGFVACGGTVPAATTPPCDPAQACPGALDVFYDSAQMICIPCPKNDVIMDAPFDAESCARLRRWFDQWKAAHC